MGLLIDRDQPLRFQFDGQLQGFAGDSIASALLGNGRFLLSRSFKYHRPRGPLTMAGQDANSLVQLPKSPTCWPTCAARDGLQVTGRTSTAAGHDRDAYLGKFSASCRWVSTTARSTSPRACGRSGSR
jgi:sarcosine oxidase subunit alpha